MSDANIQNDNSLDDIAEDPCVICLDDIKNLSTTDVCNHPFCFKCIERWSTLNDKCPFCKRQFSKIFHDFKADSTHGILNVEYLMTCEEDYDDDDESIEMDENSESVADADLERTVENILNGIELQPGESISSRFIGSDLDQNIIRTVIERAATRGLGQPDPFVYGHDSYNDEAFLLQDNTYPRVFPNPSYSNSGNVLGLNETSNDRFEGSSFYSRRWWTSDDDTDDDDDDESEAGPPTKKARYL